MLRTNTNNIGSIFPIGALLALLLSSITLAQEFDSETREYQAAQLRIAVAARIERLDNEYLTRARELRRQFNDRTRELEANAESEIELSNGTAAIGRVYQDSLAGLQREINGRRNSIYAAQDRANAELDTDGAISSETWARISSTPRDEFAIDWPPPAAPEVADVAEDIVQPTAAVAVAVPQADVPPVDEPSAAAQDSVEAPAQPAGCMSAWYPDRDRDLFGDADSAAVLECYPNRPTGFVDNNYDCDDSDATVNPITGRCGP